jgi:hypothetical protein
MAPKTKQKSLYYSYETSTVFTAQNILFRAHFARSKRSCITLQLLLESISRWNGTGCKSNFYRNQHPVKYTIHDIKTYIGTTLRPFHGSSTLSITHRGCLRSVPGWSMWDFGGNNRGGTDISNRVELALSKSLHQSSILIHPSPLLHNLSNWQVSLDITLFKSTFFHLGLLAWLKRV